MGATPAYSFDYANFILLYPAFATAPTQPQLQALYVQAGAYIANSNFGPMGCNGTTPLALNLMTAHLAQLFTQITAGQSSGITIGATIDKISTQIAPPPAKNQWQYWLQSTEYGKQLLALLQVQSVGGFYVRGGFGRAGFRP